MKNISSLIITTLLVLTAGCSLDESAQTSITDNIDPLFARELQRRGYISDARNITQGEVSGITELDLFRAADTVATRYNPHTVKRVAALNKPLILICDGEEKIPEAEYLAAEGKALIVRNGAELNAALETVNDGDVYLASDETDPLSAHKIVTRMAGLIAEAKSGEGNS